MTGEADAFRVLTLLVASCERAELVLKDLDPPPPPAFTRLLAELCTAAYDLLGDGRFRGDAGHAASTG